MSSYSGRSALGTQASIAPNDCKLDQAGTDGISSLSWSPVANFLVSSNWDGGVRCWEVQEQNGSVRAQPKAQTNHENQSPALCTVFSGDGSVVFSGGADKAVRMWQLSQGAPPQVSQQIGVHDAPIQSIGFLTKHNLVVSGGWDRKLKFWDCRTPNPVGVLDMPDRVYSLDVRDSLMVVACGNRQIISYDCSQPQPREHSRKESQLKHQTRCVAVFPDCTGYAVGSVEGRVGISYVQKVSGKDSFAFKCHRHENSQLYPVNHIAFNNLHGTFATVGSDGGVSFWDKDNKQRLKGFTPIDNTIPCAAFNGGGNLFAYASSYDWSKGHAFYPVGAKNDIFVHYTPEEEVRPKSKSSSKGLRR